MDFELKDDISQKARGILKFFMAFDSALGKDHATHRALVELVDSGYLTYKHLKGGGSSFKFSETKKVARKKESIDELVGFEEWWAAYPDNADGRNTRVRKATAKKYWASKECYKDPQAIMNALHEWKISALWTGNNGKFIKAAPNWLSNDAFLDNPNGKKNAHIKSLDDHRREMAKYEDNEAWS